MGVLYCRVEFYAVCLFGKILCDYSNGHDVGKTLPHYRVMITSPRDASGQGYSKGASRATSHESVTSDKSALRTCFVELLAKDGDIGGMKMAVKAF
jgi:hypothetical protein